MPSLDPDRIQKAQKLSTEEITPTGILRAAQNPAIRGIDPQEIYLLVSVLKHERRQEWVKFIMETRLGMDAVKLGTQGGFALEEGEEQSGQIPCEPEWSFDFHGCGCCLTHSNNTVIDVDFTQDGSATEIDRYFYNRFLTTCPNLEWCEEQLIPAECMKYAWHFDLHRLERFEFIKLEWRFRLSNSGREFAEALEPLLDAIHREPQFSPKKAYLLCVLGDFSSALKEVKGLSVDSRKELYSLATGLVTGRAERIVTAIKSVKKVEREHIHAIASLGQGYSLELLKAQLLKSPVIGAHHSALEILIHWDEIKSSADNKNIIVEALKAHSKNSFLDRAFPHSSEEDRNESSPKNSLVIKLCKEILKSKDSLQQSGFDQDSISAILEKDWKSNDSEAGFLLYLLDPKKGLEKLEKNLENSVPVSVEDAALFLAIIGTKPSIQLLIDRSQGTPELGGLASACVLDCIDQEFAQQAAQYWKQRYDGYEDAEGEIVEVNGKERRVWNIDEIMRHNARSLIKHRYEKSLKEYKPILDNWWNAD